MAIDKVPRSRLRRRNDAPVREGREYVVYWMIAARRAGWSFALDHALEASGRLGKPLVVLEALRVDYPHASARLHRFVLEGMADNARRFAAAGLAYHPYVEPSAGGAKGLLEALCRRACLVVTDEHPGFFLPRMVEAAARKLDVRLEAVDGAGLVPLAAPDRPYSTAASFRRLVHGAVLDGPPPLPAEDPLAGAPRLAPAELPAALLRRWPAAGLDEGSIDSLVDRLPIDREVFPVELRGGARAGAERLASFLRSRLSAYAEERHQPDAEAQSGLSPYLHFGHLGAHQVLRALLDHEDWTPDRLEPGALGQRAGFWGTSPSAEAFLDQLVTWRELALAFRQARPGQRDDLSALPPWARRTLELHALDPRPRVYSEEELARAETDDPLWNAAQRQLLREGTIHGYLRMLWGKKVLGWSPSPARALEVLLALNDRHALDGRDPSSAANVLWCLGLFDRPFGPERPVYGTVRYMTSKSAMRKLALEGYMARFGR